GTGFITGMYVVLTPLIALALFRSRITSAAWAGVAVSTVGLAPLGRPRRPGRRRSARARGRGRLLAADRADGTLRAALRGGCVHARRDGGGLHRARRRRAGPRGGRRAARLDGLGRVARHGRLRERAGVPRPDLGPAAHLGDAHGAGLR